MSKTIIVIPARMESSRLPGKPLLMAGGKSLVQWTYEQARQVSNLVIVTSNDLEILQHCADNGIPWMPSTEDCPNGTCRAAEVVNAMRDDRVDRHDRIIVWQVDEPLVDPVSVRLMANSSFWICTLISPVSEEEKQDPNLVKVVTRRDGKAMWFSRAPMANSYGHVGIYGFLVGRMQEIVSVVPTANAKAESLEQLSWIENMNDIQCFEMNRMPLSINTAEDWVKFKELKENEVH